MAFIHLHVHTEYSLLDGAARISKLVKTAKEDGATAVAITDHGNMYGDYKFYNACKEGGIKPIIGCEIYIVDDMDKKDSHEHRGHLVLLAKNNEGYTNLCKINTAAWTRGFYYKPRIDYDFLEKHGEGLVCLSACLAGHIPHYLLLEEYDEAKKYAERLQKIFSEDFYLELQDHGLPEQKNANPKILRLAQELNIELIVTNDVHYINREDAEVQDALICIATQSKVNDADRMRFETDQFYYKKTDEMTALIKSICKDDELTKRIIANSNVIADKCNCNPYARQDLMPEFVTPTGEDNTAYFRRMAEEGLRRIYGEITPEIKNRYETEFNVISSQGFIDYFLIVADFMRYANEQGIPVGPGRGSGAGSIIAYALGITKLDPLHYGLLFERFLHNERISVPDFDLDFCCKRRGEVIDYVTQKYGRDHVCQIVTFGTMAAKAAIKDIARVFDVPYAEVDKITKPIPTVAQGVKPPLLPYIFGLKEIKKPNKDAPEEEQEKYKKEKKKSDELRTPELCDLYQSDEQVKKIVDMAVKVEGFPRNCSMHAAGVIICKRIVGEVCPLAKNGEDITSQYDMIEIEQLGMLKMDFLGLITTTDIDGAIKEIKRQTGKDIDFYDGTEYDDANVYKMISAGDTDAVFQLESGGMKRFMQDLRPDCIADIIAGVALFRPGPMDMIPSYCRNKHNPKLTTYEHPLLENILKETYGQIVYQEQVMEIFKVLGGYSLGQADMVRRAMGKKKVSEMEKQKKIFVNGDSKQGIVGAVANGVPKDVALNIFAKMEKFAGYAFNKSHAACYAFLSYQTAYLKYYYYPFFMASMLNNRINKWEDMTHYITQMRAKDATILPPDINKSQALFTVEGKGSDVRFGLSAIKNVGEGLVAEIIKERETNGDFKDFIDFCKRVPVEVLNKRCLESMILAGCFDCFNVFRSQLMGYYPQVVKLISGEKKAEESGQMSMFAMADAGVNTSVDIPLPKVPEFDDFNKLRFEREYVGFYLSGHPLQQYAHLFENAEYNFNTDLMPKKDDSEETPEDEETEEGGVKDKDLVKMGAIITDIKKIFTRANHDEMAVLTVEDLFGTCEVMLFPKKWEAIKPNVGKDTVVKITGKLSLRDGQNPIILGDSVEPVTLSTNIEIRPDGNNKKLYMRFNLQDDYVKGEVMNILSAYSGELNVVIKDTSSGGTFDPNIKVRECRAITYELNNLIGESNVVFK